MANPRAAQIPIAKSYKIHLMEVNMCLSKPLNFPMRKHHLCNAVFFENHYVSILCGHVCWSDLHAIRTIFCILNVWRPRANPTHIQFYKVAFCSFGVMVVGAPTPFATVTFPTWQINVRKSHSLICSCCKTFAVWAILFKRSAHSAGPVIMGATQFSEYM